MMKKVRKWQDFGRAESKNVYLEKIIITLWVLISMHKKTDSRNDSIFPIRH